MDAPSILHHSTAARLRPGSAPQDTAHTARITLPQYHVLHILREAPDMEISGRCDDLLRDGISRVVLRALVRRGLVELVLRQTGGGGEAWPFYRLTEAGVAAEARGFRDLRAAETLRNRRVRLTRRIVGALATIRGNGRIYGERADLERYGIDLAVIGRLRSHGLVEPDVGDDGRTLYTLSYLGEYALARYEERRWRGKRRSTPAK